MEKLATRRGYERLEARYSDLSKDLSKKQKSLGEMASQGNVWHDNSPFEDLRDETNRLSMQVSEAADDLRGIRIVEYPRVLPNNAICYGSGIDLLLDGQAERFSLVGYGDSNPELGRLLYVSPLGKVLIGHEAGDKFKEHVNDLLVSFEIKRVFV